MIYGVLEITLFCDVFSGRPQFQRNIADIVHLYFCQHTKIFLLIRGNLYMKKTLLNFFASPLKSCIHGHFRRLRCALVHVFQSQSIVWCVPGWRFKGARKSKKRGEFISCCLDNMDSLHCKEKRNCWEITCMECRQSALTFAKSMPVPVYNQAVCHLYKLFKWST